MKILRNYFLGRRTWVPGARATTTRAASPLFGGRDLETIARGQPLSRNPSLNSIPNPCSARVPPSGQEESDSGVHTSLTQLQLVLLTNMPEKGLGIVKSLRNTKQKFQTRLS